MNPPSNGQYDGQVLVLDHTYFAIDRKPWQDAMVDWANDKVEVVSTYPQRIIHHGLQLHMPAVVRFVTPVHMRQRKVTFSKENVYARDSGKCQYCAVECSMRQATYDHVVPRVQGGRTEWTNVVIACNDCNKAKGGRTPAQANMRLLSKPKRPVNLPARANPKLIWQNGMPDAWRPFLYDAPARPVQWR